jgi:hypothetical protein
MNAQHIFEVNNNMVNKVIKMLYLFALILSIILINSCEVNNPDTASIRLLTFKDNGCSRHSKIEDDAVLNWDYKNGKVQLEFLFSTHCSASCKDSVLIEGNTLYIFLADTNHWVARCICPLKEDFDFEITGYEEVQILFNYKSATSKEYFLLVNRIIEL